LRPAIIQRNPSSDAKQANSQKDSLTALTKVTPSFVLVLPPMPEPKPSKSEKIGKI